MVKKKKSSSHISHTKTHILLKKSIAIYAFLVFVLFFTTTLAGYALYSSTVTRANNVRLERIKKIYTNIKLDDSYRIAKTDIFGDKRPYDWDGDRSFSSSIEYGHDDTPANTRAELMRHVEEAGFTRIGGAYEGSVSPQDYFKNNHGEYVRVAVMSRYTHDSFVYGSTSTNDPLVNHKDEAPTYVTLKVNLDDNNE
jgi:hypothetical protein